MTVASMRECISLLLIKSIAIYSLWDMESHQLYWTSVHRVRILYMPFPIIKLYITRTPLPIHTIISLIKPKADLGQNLRQFPASSTLVLLFVFALHCLSPSLNGFPAILIWTAKYPFSSSTNYYIWNSSAIVWNILSTQPLISWMLF